ncbi:hemolysin family protein [Romboutsia sp. 1001216sp1]|uniref:hemolysin family protein n=1 Tax=unclassified Romboutsia TaxID=2626894 RepID=UPI00189C6876|nr:MULTISPECIES: hemolysin family protein [unclassified Romboutsia]MDB8791743.1 hemolysin family protein [Romboutsia sp. 1001216sp1]MDB8801436.1 hemolysin family protein [Romboutsia sp. 1001216sp1]MDB8812834.1 hemolysin family protein [Romboutsia sp. 1001216sp1]
MSNLDSDPGNLIPQLVLIVILTSINAFFASAEMAIVSVNKSKIKSLSDEGNKKAILLQRLIAEPSNFLSTIQIGITLAGFFSSASAATGLSSYLETVLIPLNLPYTSEISMISITLLLSYFTLVFGELVPKRIALKKAESIALFSVKPVYLISIIAKPFIKILSMSTSLVLKLTKNNDVDIEEKISEEELRSLIIQSQEDGCIEYDEKQMIYKVFDFNDKLAKEIMTPRSDTFLIDIDDDINTILDEICDLNYSRIPVYKDDIDNIVGVLYIKDLFNEARKVGFENVKLENLLHEPYFVPEIKRTNELFKVLKEKKIHLSLLFDEYGGFSGIVTLEDLIEEIVGDIEDEYDLEEKPIKKIDDNNYIVKGSLSINDFNEEFELDLDEGDYDTLNGYLITNLDEIPDENTELLINDIKFTVLKVENRRIQDIKIHFDNIFHDVDN